MTKTKNVNVRKLFLGTYGIYINTALLDSNSLPKNDLHFGGHYIPVTTSNVVKLLIIIITNQPFLSPQLILTNQSTFPRINQYKLNLIANFINFSIMLSLVHSVNIRSLFFK